MRAQPAPIDDDFEVLSSPPRRITRRLRLVLLSVIVIVAAVAGIHLLTSSDHSVRITAYGQPVADPGTVLATAQQHFETYTAQRSGALGKNARCWFQRPANTPDIDSSLLCGPVLFYDGDPDRPYLAFPLVARGTGNPVRLDAASTPSNPAPAAAPVGVTLLRPEGTAQPLVLAGFAAPVPPPATPNTLAMTDIVHPDDLKRARSFAVIGGDQTTLWLYASGPVNDYGSGSAEHTAPDGSALFAFRLGFAGGENGFAPLSQLDLGVSVGTAAPRPLHLPDKGVADTGQLFVVAAPVTAPLDLVLTEHGITQRMSLRDGRPAQGNIELLQGQPRLEAAPFGASLPATVTIAGHRSPTRLDVNLNYSGRMFFVRGSGAHPRSTDHAFLWLNLTYRSALLPAHADSHFATTDVTLTPRGGAPVRARMIAGSDVPLFDVPADMTDATLTLGGTETHPGYTLSIPRSRQYQLHFVPDDE